MPQSNYVDARTPEERAEDEAMGWETTSFPDNGTTLYIEEAEENRRGKAEGIAVIPKNEDELLLLNAKILLRSVATNLERGLNWKTMSEDVYLPILEWLDDYRKFEEKK